MARKYVRDSKGQFASTPGGGKPTLGVKVAQAIGNTLSSPRSRELRDVERKRRAELDRNFNDPKNDDANSGDRYFRREAAINAKFDKQRAAVKAKHRKP